MGTSKIALFSETTDGIFWVISALTGDWQWQLGKR